MRNFNTDEVTKAKIIINFHTSVGHIPLKRPWHQIL